MLLISLIISSQSSKQANLKEIFQAQQEICTKELNKREKESETARKILSDLRPNWDLSTLNPH